MTSCLVSSTRLVCVPVFGIVFLFPFFLPSLPKVTSLLAGEQFAEADLEQVLHLNAFTRHKKRERGEERGELLLLFEETSGQWALASLKTVGQRGEK